MQKSNHKKNLKKKRKKKLSSKQKDKNLLMREKAFQDIDSLKSNTKKISDL